MRCVCARCHCAACKCVIRIVVVALKAYPVQTNHPIRDARVSMPSSRVGSLLRSLGRSFCFAQSHLNVRPSPQEAALLFSQTNKRPLIENLLPFPANCYKKRTPILSCTKLLHVQYVVIIAQCTVLWKLSVVSLSLWLTAAFSLAEFSTEEQAPPTSPPCRFQLQDSSSD